MDDTLRAMADQLNHVSCWFIMHTQLPPEVKGSQGSHAQRGHNTPHSVDSTQLFRSALNVYCHKPAHAKSIESTYDLAVRLEAGVP